MSARSSGSEGKSSAAGASDGDRVVEPQFPSPRGEEGDEEGSSSSEEEGLASPPPNKRSKRQKSLDRLDCLERQVSYISGYMSQIPQYFSSLTQSNKLHANSNEPGPSCDGHSRNTFLTNPIKEPEKLQLGCFNIEVDEKVVIPKADDERLKELKRLQQFDSPAWKGIRYKSTLRTSSATPGFVQLKVNEELCHLNKTKDYLASAEGVLAGLSNIGLEQKHLLKTGLQDLVNWAAANPQDLTPSSLFEKVSILFGPSSEIQKRFDRLMQIICGRRSECIEIRRGRILKEISSQNLRTALMDIPPSSEYLFSREALQPLVQSLGGTQTWLNAPDYLRNKNNTRDRDRQSHTYKKGAAFPTKIKPDKRNKPVFRKNNSFRHKFNRDREGKSGTGRGLEQK